MTKKAAAKKAAPKKTAAKKASTTAARLAQARRDFVPAGAGAGGADLEPGASAMVAPGVDHAAGGPAPIGEPIAVDENGNSMDPSCPR